MEYEDRLTISTPEGVELSLPLAGVGSRCTAALIDLTIQGLLLGSFALVFSFLGDALGSAYLVAGALSVVGFLIVFGYDIAWEVWGAGRTPGKRVVHLRVVRSTGAPIGFRASAVRNLMRLVDILPTLYALGFAVILATRNNQRLGDLAAGAVIVHDPVAPRRRRARTAQPPAPEPPAQASAWDISAVTAEDLSTVRGFLSRRDQLSREARAALARELAARLRAKVAGAPEVRDDEQFIAAVAAVKAARS